MPTLLSDDDVGIGPSPKSPLLTDDQVGLVSGSPAAPSAAPQPLPTVAPTPIGPAPKNPMAGVEVTGGPLESLRTTYKTPEDQAAARRVMLQPDNPDAHLWPEA